MFNYIVLNNDNKSSLETEVRFIIATAYVDGNELIALAFNKEDEAIFKRTAHQLKKILNALKKEGRISFFVDFDNLDNGSTESEFLKNKYLTHLNKKANDYVTFVKI